MCLYTPWKKNTWSDHWLPGNCAKLLAMSFAPPWLIFIHECWAKSESALWLVSLAGSLQQCTHFLMNNHVHPCTYTHKHEFSTDFSISCHNFSGSSFERHVVNIIYTHDSMHRSFCASENFTSGFDYLLHGSPLGIILVCLDKRGVKQRISVGNSNDYFLLEWNLYLCINVI